MVRFLVVSIILFPIVTASGEDFRDHVDTIKDESLDVDDLSTPAPTSEVQQVGLSSQRPRSYDPIHTYTIKTRRNKIKCVSFLSDEMIPFKQAITIDQSYPKDLSETEMIEKLLELGDSHEWSLLRLYDYHVYFKYWAYVCAFFAKENITYKRHVYCELNPSFGMKENRTSEYRGTVQSFDLLGCHCYSHSNNIHLPLSAKHSFFIHQSSANEFFVFEKKKFLDAKRLIIKNFKGGITLPNPEDFKSL